MAKSFGSFATFIALLSLSFLLLSPSEVRVVEGNTCARYSTTWSGICLDTDHCDSQCRDWEHAVHGACHEDENGFACFCYDC